MKAKSQKKAKPVKQNTAAETFAQCQPCPHTVNFFSHFHPDGVTNEDFENAVLVWGFFTGANILFPLHLPALEKMSELAFAGNQSAASFLVQLATHLSFRIDALEKQQPKVMREIARKQNVWPVLANTQPGWEKGVQTRLTELELGKAIQHIDLPFRKAGGCDENYPARRWAKAAVHCVNQTRIYQRELASRKDSGDKNLGQGTWKRGVEPAWVSETKDLPDYSNQSRPKWADVIRKMIREELPEFHLRIEWKKARSRNTKGEIQNAILDDIIAALKTITPGEINQSAENSLPNFSTQTKGC
jgi:hypothetical protein